MKIAMVAPEVAPFSKTGGLGDVLGALPPELSRLGEEVVVISLLYSAVRETVREQGLECGTGKFQAMMDVELVNDGPVTILLDSKKLF